MPEDNKTIVRRIFTEIINRGNLTLADTLIGPGYVYHGSGGLELRGPEGFKQLVTMYRSAFPDLNLTIDDILEDGNKVVTRWTGRGFAYSFRNQTIVAEIAEVEVNRDTGRVWVKRLVCAHDCGLVINPEALRRTVECAMLHSLSRALHEEVRFDGEKVTSVDWVSHPTLTHADTPETIDVVLVNGDPNASRPDLPHYGAGETMCKPTIAAVANAIYDATGVRIRRVPFRSDRVLAAIKERSA